MKNTDHLKKRLTTMNMQSIWRRGSLAAMVLLSLGFPSSVIAQPFLVESGHPRAQIVIAEQPPRMVELAAEELQMHIEKMSGATLPIVAGDASEHPVSIYVGRSSHTDRLGISDEGLKDGAFRMRSGENWLVLLGNDEEFKPEDFEPTAPPNAQPPGGEITWEALTDGMWADPLGSSTRPYNNRMDIWAQDNRGSLNAVYQFLRDHGVAWYMPGELGTVIPEKATLPLPQVDRLVRPDFGLRLAHSMSNTLFSQSRDDLLWMLRLGLNAETEEIGPWAGLGHGMVRFQARDKLKQAHPEFYAIWNGQRMTEGGGKPCLSAPGMVEAHAQYVRAVFDIYPNVNMVSIMPQDGYARVCECEFCEGKGTPERGWHGGMSDYVWHHVNRVAQEVYKTHPDKLVSCFAYGTYLLPPTGVDKLSPNLVVGLVHGRSGEWRDTQTRENAEQIRQQWLDMSSHDLLIWEHYIFTHRGVIWPAYFPHQISENLRRMKGRSFGELVEVAWGPFDERGHALHTPAFNHLNSYITARLYWDVEQDVDQLLHTYYNRFYGPAAEQMKRFIEYAEVNWHDMQGNAETVQEAMSLFNEAKERVKADSVYGRRIAQLDDYLQSLANLSEQLARGRQNVPTARAYRRARPNITLDGQFKESAWDGTLAYPLREIQTGRQPAVPTTFRAIWDDGQDGDPGSGSIYFAIRCEEPDMDALNVTAEQADDPRIWNGDCIELLIETQSHSYYQIAIAPNGTVTDVDRKGKMINLDWDSGIEVAAYRDEDGWQLEVRVPVPGGDTVVDPLHDLVGKRPLDSYPWYINVCRQRIRETDAELSAFSPTSKAAFHDIMKFGKLRVR